MERTWRPRLRRPSERPHGWRPRAIISSRARSQSRWLRSRSASLPRPASCCSTLHRPRSQRRAVASCCSTAPRALGHGPLPCHSLIRLSTRARAADTGAPRRDEERRRHRRAGLRPSARAATGEGPQHRPYSRAAGRVGSLSCWTLCACVCGRMPHRPARAGLPSLTITSVSAGRLRTAAGRFSRGASTCSRAGTTSGR